MMLKKLIPAAALLSVLGAAQAQVAIYGLIDMSYGKNEHPWVGDTKANFHSGADSGASQGNSVTKVGVKGSKEVAAGIKANFKLETNGIQSDGTIDAPFFNRQAWAGFSGNFGEIRLGKQDSVVFQTMIDFDFNGASNSASAQANSGIGTWLTGRQARSLQYIAPAMGGLTLQAGFQPEGDNDAKGVATNKANYSLGAKYTSGKLALGFATESTRSMAADAKGFTSVAASYDMGVVKAMVGYSDAGTNAKGTSLGLTAPVAGYNIGWNYSKNSDANITANEFYINREMFKSTYGYMDFGNLDTKGIKTNSYAVGVIYVF